MSESRRCPSTPVSSKFKEEFDLEPSIPESPIVRRPSKFSRLAKFAIRQHDGPAAGIDDTFGVPTTFAHSPSARKKSGAEEARGGAWGGTPRKKSKRPSKSADEVKTVLGGLAFMGNRRKKKKSTAGEENNGEDDDPKHMQELVMDSWEAEMAAIAGKAKAKSKNIVKKNKPTGPDLRYPSNWARFPSHTRHERSLSAGRPDKVQARDFGMKTVGNGEPTWYLHERKHHLYHYEGDDHSSHADDARKKGIFEKVHKILKEEIKNFENRGEPPEIEDTYGRRSSMNVPLETDFPELEILPMELRSAAQMEKEVLEQLAEQKRLQDLADTDMGTIDGSVDSGRAEVVGGISIADPKFYEDCVVTTTRQLSPDKIESRKGKFRTWAGKDFDTFKSLTSVSSGCGSGKRRRRELSLRKSTEDYHAELREMERVEREKVLSFAREVWGTRSDLRGKRDVIVSEVEVVDV
ncbi:hypothetical protein M7I_5035 [Glarea lozoyensis 74030]|uniref:Uncharacterized protein n=1 Tax=Glarea lozoyensis (strain ATCC 74030 / MF5533) TaxID=1104152 RepID=H0EQS9_GLAL7|nr:hypothetical protein M7I_5035 [Glarea lozoyensis 74030]